LPDGQTLPPLLGPHLSSVEIGPLGTDEVAGLELVGTEEVGLEVVGTEEVGLELVGTEEVGLELVGTEEVGLDEVEEVLVVVVDADFVLVEVFVLEVFVEDLVDELELAIAPLYQFADGSPKHSPTVTEVLPCVLR